MKTNIEPRDFKGVWIPKEIWLNNNLSIIEKIFLVEIDSLDNESGCYASNKYFADFFGLSRGRCTQVIKELESKEMVTIELQREGKEITKRIIRVVNKLNRVVNKLNRGSEKTKLGYLENDEENNTLSNNPINSKANLIYDSYIPNRKSEKNKTIKRIESLIKKHGEDKVVRAVDRYKQETKDTEIQFIKMSIGFFNEDYIGRFLDDNYQPIKPKEFEIPTKKYKVLK